MNLLCALLVVCSALGSTTGAAVRDSHAQELDPKFWYDKAGEELEVALNRKWNTNVARNVIIFVGDGMSLTTVTAGRILKGQKKGKSGEEEKLVFENFPNVALSKTYSHDAQIPDSAVTATALLCGVKSTYGAVGVGPRTTRGNCAQSKQHNLTCISEKAMAAGKVAGFISTARVTHATPGATYAYVADRAWEADINLPEKAKTNGCPDIAAQLMEEPARNFKVIMAGGRKNVYPNTEVDPEYTDKKGLRADGRNIAREWVDEKTARGKKAQYVWNKAEFDAVDPKTTDNLIGLFDYDHMQYEEDRAEDGAGEPSIADMTEKAIKIMNKNEKGFFLLVEAARIDHGHHDNLARKALEDTVALDNAVQRALDVVNLDETLIIVTADHSHVLAMTSYARRGNPIFGLTDYSDDATRDGLSDIDFLPYTVLSYSNGPGFTPREDITEVDTTDKSYTQRSMVPMKFASHDGTDVGIFATGAMSHLFHSTHEENYVFHAASYAACIDADKGHCNDKTPKYPVPASGVRAHNVMHLIGLFLIAAGSALLFK